MSRPSLLGSDSTPQAVWISTRALASVTGRPPGKRFPIAPASRAPRSPARRGIQANFAPDDWARAATAESPPTASESRSPTKSTDLEVKPAIEEITLASFPAALFTNFAFNFSLPREANGATVVMGSERLRTCLYKRKKTIGDSSSGSKPSSTTWSARSRSL